MATLPVSKIFGVGSVTAKKMSEIDVHTCGDLQQVGASELVRRFGKFGTRLHQLLGAKTSARSVLTVFASL